NQSGSQRRLLPCKELVFRDVLISLFSGGCGSWLPLSRNFSVASLDIGEKLWTSREHARGRPAKAGRYAYHLRHNNCQRPNTAWPSNASTPTEPTWTLLICFRPPCPKRQTIRTPRPYVK